MSKKGKDILVTGFALFAMFLGAGNLIFPTKLGLDSGSMWYLALLGFLVTGVGMPVLGIVSMGKCGGQLSDFTKNINKTFGDFFLIFIMLIIGPLFAIPRTAAVTYEIAIQPIGIGLGAAPFSIIFFAITLFFVLTPSNVVDRIGKFLTPALIVVLAMLIIKAFVTPIGVPKDTGVTRVFSGGFKEGYQTMDALGSMILATIVIASIAAKGYTKKKDLLGITVASGLIACLGLGLVYGGLLYIGATGSGVLPEGLSRTEIVVNSSKLLWGNAGSTVLGLAVGLACLTTSIGLTATAGEYFSKKFEGDISYRATVIIISVFSCFLANFGVDAIISQAAPVLEILYPVAIVLILMNLFIDYIPSKHFFRGAVIGTLCISVPQGLLYFLADGSTIDNAIKAVIGVLPFESVGFPWLVPAIVLSLIFGFACKLSKTTENADKLSGEMEEVLLGENAEEIKANEEALKENK